MNLTKIRLNILVALDILVCLSFSSQIFLMFYKGIMPAKSSITIAYIYIIVSFAIHAFDDMANYKEIK